MKLKIINSKGNLEIFDYIKSIEIKNDEHNNKPSITFQLSFTNTDMETVIHTHENAYLMNDDGSTFEKIYIEILYGCQCKSCKDNEK